MTGSNNRLASRLALAALALITTPAIAAPVFYNDRASFGAAAPALSLESFEAPDYVAPTFLIFPEIVIVAGGSPLYRSYQRSYPNGADYALSILTPASITFNFLHPVTAFGIDVIGFGTTDPEGRNLPMATDADLSQVGTAIPAHGNDVVRFAGVIDGAGFSTVRFLATSLLNLILFSALSYDAPAATPSGTVPEPASWALMIAGFGMIGGALRRLPNFAVPA